MATPAPPPRNALVLHGQRQNVGAKYNHYDGGGDGVDQRQGQRGGPPR